MLDQLRIAEVVEAAGQVRQQSGLGLDLPQQQGPCVRCDRSPIEPSRHLAASQGLKTKLAAATLCRHRAASLPLAKVVVAKQLTQQEGRPFFMRCEKCGLIRTNQENPLAKI